MGHLNDPAARKRRAWSAGWMAFAKWAPKLHQARATPSWLD
jgi:hypothetical protein